MTYRYDVFISYRHRDLDRKWARWLIRALETYRLPKALASTLRSAGRPYRIARVFRDEDETAAGGALSEEIKEALKESRSLVVVCSRNTPESKWINDEIEYFESLGHADRVIPVLVDGEPRDAFPAALRNLTDPSGSALLKDSPVDFEPLAADARPREDLSAREAKHRALLKIIAGALDVRYDDLYQRDRRRRRGRLIGIGVAVSLGLAIWLSWLAWTRTDAYQVRAVRETAPLLFPSSQGEDIANWSRALVLSGYFDEAMTAVGSAASDGGDDVEAVLATAEAARTVKRESDADRLMVKAAELTRNYKPAFGMELRLKVARSLVKQAQFSEAREVIGDAISASRYVKATDERMTSLRSFADLAVEMGDLDYLRQVIQNQGDPIVVAISSMVAAEAAARAGQMAEARRLTGHAIAASQHRRVGAHQPYLVALLVDSAASLGLLSADNGLLKRALRQARHIPGSVDKSRALRQIAAAMSQLARPHEARAVLAEIVDLEQRNDASEIVAKAFARAGKADGIKEILSAYPDQGDLDMDRYSVISGIAKGLAEGRQVSILPQFEDLLTAFERVEIRVIAAETWRESAITAERDDLLNQALHIARATPRDDEQQEMLERIGSELLEGGRADDALIVAREAADPHSRTFGLLEIAKRRMSEGRLKEMRALLNEAATAEEEVKDADLRAAGFREIGRVLLNAGDSLEAMKVFRRAVDAAAEGGEYGSSTVADVAEEYVRLGKLHAARTISDRYCQDSDRLRVYATILLRRQGTPREPS